MQPYHVIPGSPLLICYQMSDRHVGKWKDNDWQMFETAATLKMFNLYERKLYGVHRICKSSHKMKECCAACTGRYAVYSSITLKLNWNRMLSFWHSPWWIRQLFVVIFGVSRAGYISRWRRRLRWCRWLSAPVTSPSNGPWLPVPWRTNPLRACSVSEPQDHNLHLQITIQITLIITTSS